MSFNKVIQNGRLPRFEGTYVKGEGEKKSFLSWCISVKRSYKRPEDQYYKEDLLRFKVFGATADHIMNSFKQGDGLIIEGNLQVEDDYQDKNGNTVKGQMVIMVEKVSFADGRQLTAETAGAAKPAMPSIPGAKPVAGKPSIPGVPAGRPPVIPGNKPAFGGGRPAVPSFNR